MRLIAFLALGAVLSLLFYWWQWSQLPVLEKAQARGFLEVGTRYGATTYFLTDEGPAGFEYDLVAAFAKSLDLDIEMRTFADFGQMMAALEDGSVDFVTASVTITESRLQKFDFSTPYQQIGSELVYRDGRRKPNSLAELVGKDIQVLANTAYVNQLISAQEQLPELRWQEVRDLDLEGILEAVDSGLIEYTVADRHFFSVYRRYFPRLRSAFSIGDAQPQAWAFARSDDQGLVDEASAFIQRAKQQGLLARLEKRYFSHIDAYDQAGTYRFLSAARERLPALAPSFKQAAVETGFDWRLLAAMGYQESFWMPKARSPTGVRGVMMLTRTAAGQMGVEDRLDAQQSINGGSKYLQKLVARLPSRIMEPDRTWLGLAAYNVGMSHLEDARVLAQRAGKNPDSWHDVRESLPLLSKKEWYLRAKHGYARGREPVIYVDNIRSYYEILQWLDWKN